MSASSNATPFFGDKDLIQSADQIFATPATELQDSRVIHGRADVPFRLLFAVHIQRNNPILTNSDGMMPTLADNVGFTIVDVVSTPFKDEETCVSVDT